jgi:hypothetical protein
MRFRGSGCWQRRHGKSLADAQALLDALSVLGSDGAAQKHRELAALQLLRQLRILAPLWAHKKFRPSGGIGSRAGIHDIGDAIQHVALVASTGKARFRGAHPGQAMVWCERIFVNHLVSELRWRSRQAGRRRVLAETERHDSAVAPTGVSAAEGVAAGLTALVLDRLRVDALKHLERTRRPDSAESLYRAVCCYLEHVGGVALDRQLERWAPRREPGAPDQLRRARNCLYRYHLRGKRVLAEVLEASGSQGHSAADPRLADYE